MIAPNIGILEIFGFVLLLLTSSRNPKQGHLLLNSHEDSPFDKIREKIIPDNPVHSVFVLGILFVIVGLFLQWSY